MQVFAHRLDRLLEAQAPHRLDGDLVADAEAQDEAAARKLVEARGHLGHRGRVSRIYGQNPGAEVHPFRRIRVRRKDKGRVASVRHLSGPDGFEAETLGHLGPEHGLLELFDGRVENAELSHYVKI